MNNELTTKIFNFGPNAKNRWTKTPSKTAFLGVFFADQKRTKRRTKIELSYCNKIIKCIWSKMVQFGPTTFLVQILGPGVFLITPRTDQTDQIWTIRSNL